MKLYTGHTAWFMKNETLVFHYNWHWRKRGAEEVIQKQMSCWMNAFLRLLSFHGTNDRRWPGRVTHYTNKTQVIFVPVNFLSKCHSEPGSGRGVFFPANNSSSKTASSKQKFITNSQQVIFYGYDTSQPASCCMRSGYLVYWLHWALLSTQLR